jgi:hypothetical protein
MPNRVETDDSFTTGYKQLLYVTFDETGARGADELAAEPADWGQFGSVQIS